MNADPSCAGQRFAAVIVNYNGGLMLSECVRSCLGEGIPPARIVVVDNGSRDGSAEDLESKSPASSSSPTAATRASRARQIEAFGKQMPSSCPCSTTMHDLRAALLQRSPPASMSGPSWPSPAVNFAIRMGACRAPSLRCLRLPRNCCPFRSSGSWRLIASGARSSRANTWPSNLFSERAFACEPHSCRVSVCWMRITFLFRRD